MGSDLCISMKEPAHIFSVFFKFPKLSLITRIVNHSKLEYKCFMTYTGNRTKTRSPRQLYPIGELFHFQQVYKDN